MLACLLGSWLVTNADTKLYDKKPDYWVVESTIKVVPGSSSLVKLANKTISEAEMKDFAIFLKMAKTDVPDMKYRGIDAHYEYNASTEIMWKKPHFISVVIWVYVYTAGAHGMQFSRHYNFALINGKPKRVSVWDVLKSGPSDKQSLQLALLGKAMAQDGTDWVQDGTVTEFSQTQLDHFWVSDEGIAWEFAPYELGSYASGPFTLKLNKFELKPFLKQSQKSN